MKSDFSWLFELRGEVKDKFIPILLVIGLGFILLLWILLTNGSSPLVPSGILPSPFKVLKSFSELITENDLIKNIFSSYALNLGGYFKALLWAIPIGFAVGLVPLLRGMFLQFVNALRFLPLTAVTSLFIVWYGIGTPMKMTFLAFGIIIYLLPTIIQRIDEVEDVYLTTVYTLGANKWQTIKSVYWPAVMSKLSDDIRVLTAISWTYIIVIENIGSNGGLGFLMHGPTARQGRVDKMFALLIIIMLIGVIQDRVFLSLDRKFFPHKYQLKDSKNNTLNDDNVLHVIWDYFIKAATYTLVLLYIVLLFIEISGVLGNVKPLNALFDDKVWSIHLMFLLIIGFMIYDFIKNHRK